MSLTDGHFPELSWRGLIANGFAYALKKGQITEAQVAAWRPQIASADLDDVLSAAEFMSRKLDAPTGDMYARWLEHVFKQVSPSNRSMTRAIRALSDRGIPLCTLNYDSLLEQVTGLPAVVMPNSGMVSDWIRGTTTGVLHLHGSWQVPSTCVLGIRDYESATHSDVRDFFQRYLASFRVLLFVGCGNTFADPNLGTLIKWLRNKMKTAAPEHIALVTAAEVNARHADASWHGFVEPLGYGKSHADLAAFLRRRFEVPRHGRSEKPVTAKPRGRSEQHISLLNAYRAFLLRDCGQMTIEGVRADMDTAQRKFDLERLFVPLELTQPPPTIANDDPRREQILQDWLEKNNAPKSFGEVFGSRARIALLALPGGGKTLLLKRLAVAYADPTRRAASGDNLPDLDLLPVLIRCREWREHLHRPLSVVLTLLPEITGQRTLDGLDQALMPLFKSGRALLLIDGLDEIHDDSLRAIFVDHLETFLNEYRTTRLVVTSREAGFGLIAPSIARFSESWRIAPLNNAAIVTLTGHWHRLMGGESPEALAEAREVADQMITNDPLHRLAENPLLLTMLLVVKHGAGRLPPDRVTLYSRAVEVLLDTWNIKGHSPLNPKEAVPQLAYVAFEMMRAGKQTATERELLTLIESARDNVPQIRRYAKDAPHEFLKRVELRSSLVVEAGYQTEGANTVPFYQFRHLTFQEHLAAIAAVEGHYAGYESAHTPLVPLSPYLTMEEWKEVIPMSAVLARKQAEPLLAELVRRGEELKAQAEAGVDFEGMGKWLAYPPELPAPVARMAQCLAEEAEAGPDTLPAALRLLAFFGKGCRAAADWRALARGPYGDELRHQAWELFRPMGWRRDTWLLNTLATLLTRFDRWDFWISADGQGSLRQFVSSPVDDDILRGLLICVGLLWNHEPAPTNKARELDLAIRQDAVLWAAVERSVFSDDAGIWSPAVWIWAYLSARLQRSVHPQLMERLVALWFSGELGRDRVGYALFTQTGIDRGSWRLSLKPAQIEEVRRVAEQAADERNRYDVPVSLLIGFHARDVWSDAELASRLRQVIELPLYRLHFGGRRGSTDMLRAMLAQLGAKSVSRRPKRAND